jgi:hypothetical protein
VWTACLVVLFTVDCIYFVHFHVSLLSVIHVDIWRDIVTNGITRFALKQLPMFHSLYDPLEPVLCHDLTASALFDLEMF